MAHTEALTPENDTVVLPLPPKMYADDGDMEIYARFMRHLRQVPTSRMEIKVLSAIQFTADMMDYSDAHIAKILVDHGLRAPRTAFPADFLHYADRALRRADWEIGGPGPALKALDKFWGKDGREVCKILPFRMLAERATAFA